MGRQLQLATTQLDEVELLRFIRSRSPIRVFQNFAWSIDELWIDGWETREISATSFHIWPQVFNWLPEYAQTGGPNCRPEDAGQFYIANAHCAPIFDFKRSSVEKLSYGRIYWARDFAAPHGLAYDVGAFAHLTDAVWRWIRKVSNRLPNDRAHSPYFLPGAWSRYGSRPEFAAKRAARERELDELVARNRKYCIEVLGGRPVKDES